MSVQPNKDTPWFCPETHHDFHHQRKRRSGCEHVLTLCGGVRAARGVPYISAGLPQAKAPSPAWHTKAREQRRRISLHELEYSRTLQWYP